MHFLGSDAMAQQGLEDEQGEARRAPEWFPVSGA